ERRRRYPSSGFPRATLRCHCSSDEFLDLREHHRFGLLRLFDRVVRHEPALQQWHQWNVQLDHSAAISAPQLKEDSMFARRVLRPMLTLAVFLLATQAPAQVARVFLSGTGDDLNDCTNAATPCRSLQGAVNQCPVKGEIIITTSGGFGTATISKSLTVNAPSGVVAFNARTITVSLGYGDLVVIRGLSMNGAVFADSYGIDFQGSGGVLVVENSIIAGFGVGINSAFSLTVHNCELRN